jgi:hypothetical protein
LNEEVLDHILWRTCFGRSSGPVTRQITELINAHMKHYRKELDSSILPIEVSAVGWDRRILYDKLHIHITVHRNRFLFK